MKAEVALTENWSAKKKKVFHLGGWKESAQKLANSSVYWEPDSDNFPNIDAAINVSEVLHCIQCFPGRRAYPKFNIDTFLKFFMTQLPHGLRFSNVVHFVTPEDRACEGVVSVRRSGDTSFAERKCGAHIECEGELKVKWNNKKSDDDDDDSSSTKVESARETPTGAILTDDDASEMMTGCSRMSETGHPDEAAAKMAMEAALQEDWNTKIALATAAARQQAVQQSQQQQQLEFMALHRQQRQAAAL